ncbi:hypothetical protein GCM10022409_00520 [Hymenobacter glaciei]|uniref:Restriction endonuclease n=1 Tax=Hymenobacter glaciei TaxID=877209 RepID=A0ABP7T4B2_9BACT
MNLTRRLTEGVGAWLHFEYVCNRSGLFNEHYLSFALGQLMSAAFGNRVNSEFDHPILAPLMKGRGRRPAIDFVYCDPYPTVKVAVETKWAGSSHTTIESIIWDLIRLEMVAHYDGTSSIFILAGKRSDLIKLFNRKDFSGPPNTPGVLPILSTTHNQLTTLSLLPDKPYRIPVFQRVFGKVQDVPIPHRIVTRRTQPFPAECKNNQYQVFAWEIMSDKNRQEFNPNKIFRYMKAPGV